MTEPQAATASPVVRGQLTGFPVPHLFYLLNHRRFTGAVDFVLEDDNIRVLFHSGMPCGVQQHHTTEPLGRVLVEMGLITQDEYHASLLTMASTKMKQGEVLIEMGCITDADLRRSLIVQLRRKLNRLFFIKDAPFVISPDSGLVRSAEIKLPALPLIYHGIRNAYSEPELEAFLDGADKHEFSVSPEFHAVEMALPLNDTDRRLATALEKGHTLQELAATCQAPRAETAMFLAYLRVLDLLLIDGKPAVNPGVADLEGVLVPGPASAAEAPFPASTPGAAPATTMEFPALAGLAKPEPAVVAVPESSDLLEEPDGEATVIRAVPKSHQALAVDKPVVSAGAFLGGGPVPLTADSFELDTATDVEVAETNDFLGVQFHEPPPRPRTPAIAYTVDPQTENTINTLWVHSEQADYFALLNVETNATSRDIQTAYFNLVKLLHPDRLSLIQDPELRSHGESAFQRISEAYNVLVDPDRRAKYLANLEKERTSKISTPDALIKGSEPSQPKAAAPFPMADDIPARPASSPGTGRPSSSPNAAPFPHANVEVVTVQPRSASQPAFPAVATPSKSQPAFPVARAPTPKSQPAFPVVNVSATRQQPALQTGALPFEKPPPYVPPTAPAKAAAQPGAHDKKPDDVLARAEFEFQKGVFYATKQDFKRAVEQFEKAIAIYPDQAEYYSELSFALFNLTDAERPGRLKEAVDQVMKSLRLNPRSETAHYRLAVYYKLSQQLEQAKAHFRMALQYNPNNAQAAAELKILESLTITPEPKSKSGFFGRFFGKKD